MDNNKVKEILEKAASTLEVEMSKTAELGKKVAEQETSMASMQEKIASYERKERCEVIASKMIEKGLLSPSDFQSEVRKLASGKEDLDVMAKLAEYMAPKEAGMDYMGGEEDTSKMTPEERFENKWNGKL